ncbi:MAG: PD-(D/E)XK nuclease family protein [Piscinibacter sp.]
MATRVREWAAVRDLPLRDVVLLLPFSALLPPAREAFARGGGWQPRIETARTCAASLAPPVAVQPMQLSFDAAADRLVAARLLRLQSVGAAWAKADPRRFDRAVAAVVETAQALAGAAHELPPDAREAYWADARQRLAPSAGPGAQQRWLARLALEWAAQSAAPATDRLFEAEPAGWVALQAGGPDGLVESLLAAARCPCLIVDADADADAGLSSRTNIPSLARCPGFEDEAQAAAAQVLVHLERGEHPVALIGLDRQLVRRIRALLERQHVPLADETGWTLSTTRAAALVMAILRAASPRAGTDMLFDGLKALPGWPGVEAADNLLRAIERECRRRAISRVERLAQAELEPALADHVARIDAVLALLRGGPASVAEWLSRLAGALRGCGAWDMLSADAAGQAVLRALRLDEPAAGSAAWHDAASQARMGLDGFVAWADAVLEGGSFTPPGPAADTVRVVITPLARAMLRPFAALVCPGADDRHLGAAPAAHPLLSEAEQVALRLSGRAQRQQREALAFAQALAAPRVTFLRRHVDTSGEPLADSPLLQRLGLDLAQQGRAVAPWQDPRVRRQLEWRPVAHPQPVASEALPGRVSASAVEALRDCPYRFFARHVLGLREDDELEAELEKRDFGDWLHRVLYRFHAQRQAPGSVEDESRQLHAIASQEQGTQGLSDDEFLPFAASFARLVPRYLEWLHRRDDDGDQWQAGEREARLRTAATGGIELYGVIDRIDRVEHGAALQLIDYKTSSPERLKARVRQPLEDTQLAFYAALLAPEAGRPLRACYLPLEPSDAIKPIVHDNVQRSAEVLVRELGAEFDRLRAGASLPALGEGEVCEHCEARGLCRRDHWPDGSAA